MFNLKYKFNPKNLFDLNPISKRKNIFNYSLFFNPKNLSNPMFNLN